MSKLPFELTDVEWPPEASDEEADAHVQLVQDWQITHSSLLKRPPDGHPVNAQPIGVATYPTLFPKHLLDKALGLQKHFNELYTAIACDEQWPQQALEPLMTADSLVSKLWRIHLKVKEEGYIQPTSLGIFRSDYMLHCVGTQISLKQVEINTLSCAGCCHSSQISGLHQHLYQIDAYPPSLLPNGQPILHPTALPPSDNIASLASVLARDMRRTVLGSHMVQPGLVSSWSCTRVASISAMSGRSSTRCGRSTASHAAALSSRTRSWPVPR